MKRLWQMTAEELTQEKATYQLMLDAERDPVKSWFLQDHIASIEGHIEERHAETQYGEHADLSTWPRR